MRVIVLAALGAALCAGTARAADVLAPPFWTSDQIRAARNLEPEPALSFDVRVTNARTGKPATVETRHVVLASSFVEIALPGRVTLYDQALCRRIEWSDGRQTLVNVSCYATPAVKMIELANRRAVGLVVGGNPAVTAAEAEAELGVRDNTSRLLERRTDADADEYSADGVVIARLSGKAADLDPAEARAAIRLLAQAAPLHPQACGDIAANARLPARLEMRTGPEAVTTWEIANVRRAPAAYPLPSGLAPETGDAQTLAGEGLAAAIQAATKRSTIPKQSEQAAIASLDEAVRGERMMEALFRFLFLTQQYAGALTSNTPQQQAQLAHVRAAFATILKDPQAARFWAASALAADPNAPGDRESAARYLAGLKLDGVMSRVEQLEQQLRESAPDFF